MSDDERPALFVDAKDPHEDFDLDIPPATGHEYLRRVMQEARGCPRVVIADMDANSYLHKPTLKFSASSAMQAPAGLAPTTQWQKQQAADFSDVRQKMTRWKARLKTQNIPKPTHLPPRSDVEAWCRLSFGRLKPKDKQILSNQMNGISGSDDDEDDDVMNVKDDVKDDDNVIKNDDKVINDDVDNVVNDDVKIDENNVKDDENVKDDDVNDADVSTTTQEEASQDDSQTYHQVEPESTEVPANYTRSPPLLNIVGFMDQPTVVRVLEYHINWFEATGFSKEQGEWMYALLVCLEKPLDPEACSLLRHLARACSTLRATLETDGHPFLAPLNLFICLVAHYFDQKDLADDS